MSSILFTYPILTEEQKQKAFDTSNQFCFFYKINGEMKPLNCQSAEEDEHTLSVIDPACEWSPVSNNLIIKKIIKIKNSALLFGKNGVACVDSDLGLALSWKSKISHQRGISKIGKIISSHQEIKFEAEIFFEPGQLWNSFDIDIIVYIMKGGNPDEDERHLANEAGIVVGTIDSSQIMIEGTSSTFPIVETNDTGKPLWWIECNWNDPREDFFTEENIKVCINTAHKDYSLLTQESGLQYSSLFREILASALSVVIEKVKSEKDCWADTVQGLNLSTGSISHAIFYFIKTFEWDISSPEKLAISIRKDLDVRL